MSWNSKRKLAIVAGISECLVYAEAKYCAFEIHGEPKYYVCPIHEYCCNFGCCVSPGYPIYHLWYYWLLVIIMFLVCSGGGWWYRYWLQGRYRAAASAIPSRGAASTRGQSSLRGPTCPAQQASITYNSARNTVLLHRMWKAAGPHRGPGSSPAYTGPPVAAAASSTHFQNTSVVLNDVNCPYYQLYGPPPSYETVIAQTRGKLSTPLSPEHSTHVDASPTARGGSILQNQDTPSRCYNHSPYSNHPSQNGSLGEVDNAISRYEQSTNVDTIQRLESLEASSGFSRYSPSYVGNGEGTTPVHTAGRQDACLPLHYRGGPLPPLDYHDDHAAIVPDTYRIYNGSDNLERLPSYHGERTSLDPKTRRHNGISPNSLVRDTQRCSLQLPPAESHSSVPDLKINAGDINGHRRAKTPQDDQREHYSRNYGGSLKFSRTRAETSTTFSASHENSRRRANFLDKASTSWTKETANFGLMGLEGDSTSGVDDFGDIGSFSRSTRKGLLTDDAGRNNRRFPVKQQTNPSDNVILEPLTSVLNINAANGAGASANHDEDAGSSCWRTPRRRYDNDEKRRRRVPSPGARGIVDDEKQIVETPFNNHESKHNKLDRSKSLE